MRLGDPGMASTSLATLSIPFSAFVTVAGR